MVRVGMSASDSPIVAKRVISALYDKATLEIVGFLAIEGKKLVRCNQDFVGCSDVISSSALVFSGGEIASNHLTGHIILNVDNALYNYNVSTKSLSSALYTFSSPGITVAALVAFQSRTDGSHLYFSDGRRLIKLAMDGSTPQVTLVTESVHISRVELTENSVVYQTNVIRTATPSSVKAISKSGGAAIFLTSSTTGTVVIRLFGTAGNFVYYNELKSGGVFESGVMKDDGTGKVVLTNSSWVGPSTVLLSGKTAPLTKIIRIENCAGLTCELKSYDAATSNGEVVLGPSNALPTFSGFGNNILGFDIDAGSKGDIFFVNLNKAGSLKRMTTTSAISEVLIPISD